MKKLIPLVLLLIGISGGVGAGLILRPDVAPLDDFSDSGLQYDAGSDQEMPPQTAAKKTDNRMTTGDFGGNYEYIKLNNQFVVPIIIGDSVESLIVMSLSLEVEPGQTEAIYLHEPKLRDEFLQVMFDHANMGGFRGVFTDTERLDTLRRGFREVAEGILGPTLKSVLITDITRQKL